jgi:hypothetical protein
MGWLDDLVQAGKGAAEGTPLSEKVDYWTCVVPYYIDDEWPLTARPTMPIYWILADSAPLINPEASNGNLIKADTVCGIAGWYQRMWCDYPTGIDMPDPGREVLCGSYSKNTKTGEEIWTVYPWAPDRGGYQLMLDTYAGKIVLADPPAKAPTSGFYRDPEAPTYHEVPPGTDLGNWVDDPKSPAGGYYMTQPGSKIPGGLQQAGFPWGALLAIGVVGAGTYFWMKRKKKRGKKKSKRAWGSRKPAWEI